MEYKYIGKEPLRVSSDKIIEFGDIVEITDELMTYLNKSDFEKVEELKDNNKKAK
jgi:protein-arginine kinase activator protein McsA